MGKPFLLIGGQAVYFWATAYLAREPSLEQWQPFVSKDIDFQGSRDDLVQFCKQLGIVPRFPHKKEMTAWAGVAQIKVAGETTSVDFLRFMPGVKPHDAVRFAVERDSRYGTRISRNGRWLMANPDKQHRDVADSMADGRWQN